jgi:regulator of protease activity HflC (stomatin/prohibitin superfamily)
MYILFVVVVILLALSLRVVKEYDRGVIFFLGKCTGVRGPGLLELFDDIRRSYQFYSKG